MNTNEKNEAVEAPDRPVNIDQNGKPLPEPQPGDLIIIDGPRLAQVISRDGEAIVYAELSDCSSGKALDTSKRYGHGAYDNVDIVPPLPITTPQAAALYVGDIAEDKDGNKVRIGDTIATTDGSHLGGVVVAVADDVVIFHEVDDHYDVVGRGDFTIVARTKHQASPTTSDADNRTPVQRAMDRVALVTNQLFEYAEAIADAEERDDKGGGYLKSEMLAFAEKIRLAAEAAGKLTTHSIAMARNGLTSALENLASLPGVQIDSPAAPKPIATESDTVPKAASNSGRPIPRDVADDRREAIEQLTAIGALIHRIGDEFNRVESECGPDKESFFESLDAAKEKLYQSVTDIGDMVASVLIMESVPDAHARLRTLGTLSIEG